MDTEQHEALKLAENIDEFSGYCTGFAAKTIRTQHVHGIGTKGGDK